MEFRHNHTYVIATRSNSWLSKAIRYFSERGSGLYEFDHVLLYRNGDVVHMTRPRTKFEPFEWRSENHIYVVRKQNALSAWEAGIESYERGERYGYLQLVSKAFTMLFGLNPWRVRQDCIEAIMRWIIPDEFIDFDKPTVAQGIKWLENNNFIRKVGVKK